MNDMNNSTKRSEPTSHAIIHSKVTKLLTWQVNEGYKAKHKQE